MVVRSLFWKGIKQLHANFIYRCLAQLLLGKYHVVSLCVESYRRSLEKFVSLVFFFSSFFFYTGCITVNQAYLRTFVNENIPNISPFAD